MATIVTRSGKGSPLTHPEVDANFTNLNTAKFEAGNTILSASGTASSPGIAFSADTNTGLFRAGADILGIAIGGAEAATFEDAGQTVFQLLSSDGDQLLNVDETTDDLLQVINTDDTVLFEVSNTTGVTSSVGFTGTTAALSGNITMSGTGAIKLPVGTDAQRPTPATGQLRFSSTSGSFEGYDGSAWGSIGGGGGGYFKGENGAVGDPTTGPGDIFRINEQALNTSVTIGATENASATGPLTIASGVTLTVTSGGNLSIV
jgi:hypothetical protein